MVLVVSFSTLTTAVSIAFPLMEITSREVRISNVYRVNKGLVLKLPWTAICLPEDRIAELKDAFVVERQLPERQGRHP